MAGPVTIAWSRARPGDAASLPDVGTRQTARLRRLSGVAADRFAVGRGFAAALIREIAGVDAATDLVSECERCGIGTHGRLRDAANRVALSVAYADDLVVVTAATGGLGASGPLRTGAPASAQLAQLTAHQRPKRRPEAAAAG